jgi:hypothetical protein
MLGDTLRERQKQSLEGNLKIMRRRKKRTQNLDNAAEAEADRAGVRPPPQHTIIQGVGLRSARRGPGQAPAIPTSPPWWNPMRAVTLTVLFLGTSLPALLIRSKNLEGIKNHSKKGRSLKFQSSSMLPMMRMSKKLSPS